jgi:hypothetical protein
VGADAEDQIVLGFGLPQQFAAVGKQTGGRIMTNHMHGFVLCRLGYRIALLEGVRARRVHAKLGFGDIERVGRLKTSRLQFNPPAASSSAR